MKLGDSVKHPKYGNGVVVLVKDSVIGATFTDAGRVNFAPSEIEVSTDSDGRLRLAKTPACVRADRITWDELGQLAWVFGFWAKNIKFYADIPPKYQSVFEKKYRSIFGYDPEPKEGLYNISQDAQKWTIETEITFPVTDRLPEDLERLQTARQGKIARTQLFWALMEHGFELTGTQNIDSIRQHVPEQQREFFDKGTKGE